MKKIKIIKKIIINGDFNGKYQGKEISDLDNTNFLDYDINIFKAEVTNAVKKEYLEYISNNSISFKLKQLKDVKIGLVESELENNYKFIEDLEDVVIYDIEFYDVTKDLNETYGAIRGKIYANISYEEEIELVPLPPQKKGEIVKQKLRKVKEKVKYNFFPVLSKVFYILLAICLIAIFKENTLYLLLIGLGIYFFRVILKFIIDFIFKSSYIVLIVLILFGLFTFFTNSFEKTETDNVEIEEIENDINFSKIISRPHSWFDNSNRKHSSVFKFKYGDYLKSKENKENIDNYYNNEVLYKTILNFDKSKLDLIYDVYNEIKLKGNYSRKEFADVIISSVQSIPYSFNIPLDCNNTTSLPEVYKDGINSGTSCISYVKHDILTPLEFFNYFKGDCDSRTTLLFTLLKKFNYDVVILNSDLYTHSMLGINVPSRGKYKLVNGKKYFFCETTYPGWKIGVLPPDTQNISKWYVALK